MNFLVILIISLLMLASTVIEYQCATRNTAENRNNRKRLHTWWLICAICIPVFYAGGWAITALVYALIYGAAFEFSKLLDVKISAKNTLLFTVILITYHISSITFTEYLPFYFITPILIFFTSAAFIRPAQSTMIKTPLILLFCITSVFSVELIKQLCLKTQHDFSLVILFLFFITASNDIFQYISGKILGHTPLARNLSPQKTIEGALGGILLTTGLSIAALPRIVEVSWQLAALIGGFISIFAIAGDLHISYIKRLAKVKDSGSSLPGHGGLLDRIDSLTLSAPVYGLCLTLVFTYLHP